jgi:streptomycin 6-kinase
MKKLTKNITNLFGEKGKLWLNNLPEITNKLSEIWNLSDLSAYNNLSYNYVLKGFQTRENKTKKNKKHPIALKRSCEQKMIQDEINALKHFHGHGSVAIIADNLKYHALLLEQVIPGTTLKSYYLENTPESIANSMDYYADIINNIKSLPLPKKT